MVAGGVCTRMGDPVGGFRRRCRGVEEPVSESGESVAVSEAGDGML